MNEEMKFPNAFEEFLNEYSFKDSDEVYTNGNELIQTFRVMQGYEHFAKQIREDAIEEFAKVLKSIKRPHTKYLVSTFERDIDCVAEQLKEKKNDRARSN